MDFERFANESTGDTIKSKVKTHLKILLISLAILISLILVITILCIIFTRGESAISPSAEATFENATTYEFHSRLNRFHSVKLNVSCTIPGPANEKCPEDIKAYEEFGERAMLEILKQDDDSIDVYFSKNRITIENASTVNSIERAKSIVNVLERHLTEKEKEGIVYNEEDFGRNWTFGVKLAQATFYFDANLENNVTESFHCFPNSPEDNEFSANVLMRNDCAVIRAGFGNSFTKEMIKSSKVVFGATRLNGTVVIGYDKPWLTVEVNAMSQTDGGVSVRKLIHQFNEAEIAICKCLENTRATNIIEEAEELQACSRKLKIRENIQGVMDRSRCKF